MKQKLVSLAFALALLAGTAAAYALIWTKRFQISQQTGTGAG